MTGNAYAHLQSTRSASKVHTELEVEDVLAALNILVKLDGIGPATASLLLSVADPQRIPFFSDEVFQWMMWEDSGKDGKAGRAGGWKRKIGYTAKEYRLIYERVTKLRERLRDLGKEVSAADVEKVSWTLKRLGSDEGAKN